jgi:polyketide biosynthesis acyl carrier protein
MNKEEIFELIKQLLVKVVPSMKGEAIAPDDAFKSYAVNSIERMEVVMLLLEEVDLDIPRIELLEGDTFGDLAAIVERKLIKI